MAGDLRGALQAVLQCAASSQILVAISRLVQAVVLRILEPSPGVIRCRRRLAGAASDGLSGAFAMPPNSNARTHARDCVKDWARVARAFGVQR